MVASVVAGWKSTTKDTKEHEGRVLGFRKVQKRGRVRPTAVGFLGLEKLRSLVYPLRSNNVGELLEGVGKRLVP